nr:GNAT family N-acetyltransferase [Nocardioides sp. zg-DK7169]
MERSFPPELLAPPSERGTELGSDVRRVRVALDGDRVVGCAVLRRLPLAATCLEYLAVDPDTRSGGVGRALLDDAVALAAEAGGDWLVLEVEPVDSATADPDHGDPARRMRFYERAGAFAACTGYGAPDLAAGTGIVDLELLVIAARPGASGPTMSQVVDWTRALWGPDGYGRAADDPDLRAVLARLGY